VAQVVEHLSSKCEALSSNPSTAKKKKTKTKKQTNKKPNELKFSINDRMV
jgi:hypothetical protein